MIYNCTEGDGSNVMGIGRQLRGYPIMWWAVLTLQVMAFNIFIAASNR